MTNQEYIKFMYNPENICNCDSCPENKGHDGNGFDHRYPCDQQNCWVECHCRCEEEAE